ncbi:hypothetical protein GCM10009639_33940 [Kitasatospora putterlickiae]|uniref:Protein kilB n=1 Tax=Kitasatospora putterlickiae TaxID=221725 RepID=A0ABN1Y3T6_9ACTN
MWQSIVAIVGTLAGAITTGLVQQRGARAAREADRADAARAQRAQAVTALLAALADHRLAMVLREEARLDQGTGSPAYTAARDRSHRTRSAVTAPHTNLAILAPDLAPAAQTAVNATYAIRGARDADVLETRRAAAAQATDDLITAAQS